MRRFLALSWWMLVARGAASVLFGVLALTWPELTLLVLVLLFGVYVLSVGWLVVIASLRTKVTDWWIVLLLGLASIMTGSVALLHPRMTAFVLAFVMGAGALATGIIDTWIAIRLRSENGSEWLLVPAGVLSILLGAFVLLSSGAGALALSGLIAIQSIAIGVLFLISSFRARADTV